MIYIFMNPICIIILYIKRTIICLCIKEFKSFDIDASDKFIATKQIVRILAGEYDCGITAEIFILLIQHVAEIFFANCSIHWNEVDKKTGEDEDCKRYFRAFHLLTSVLQFSIWYHNEFEIARKNTRRRNLRV